MAPLLEKFLYNSNGYNIQLYDEYGNKIKIECALSAKMNWKFNQNLLPYKHSAWIITKLVDLVGNDKDCVKNADGIYAAILNKITQASYIHTNGIWDEGMAIREAVLNEDIRFCIIDGVAYEYIDSSFQQYLENDVANWVVYIINNQMCLHNINNEYDLIFNILNIGKERLNKIAKKSIFLGIPECLEHHIHENDVIAWTKYSINDIAKCKDYYALGPLVNLFNKNINGYNTIIEDCRAYDKLNAGSYSDDLVINPLNYIKINDVRKCGDSYIYEMWR